MAVVVRRQMAAGDPPESRHRIKVRILVVLASIFAFLAILTSWIDRQLLDTDQFVETSGEMLEERVISDAIADYAVDQLFTKVNIAKTLDRRLPDDLKPLAGPISGGAVSSPPGRESGRSSPLAPRRFGGTPTAPRTAS